MSNNKNPSSVVADRSIDTSAGTSVSTLDNSQVVNAHTPTLSRRTLLTGAVAGATVAATALAQKGGNGNGGNAEHPVLGGSRSIRSQNATRLREKAAKTHLQEFIQEQRTNGDEAFADKRGSFSKTLPHNRFGEVDTQQYQALLRALDSGNNADFEQIQLAPNCTRRLANPQGAYKFEMVGRDAHNTFIRPAPPFLGAETAGEMGELYWKALCRDVPFCEFDNHPLIAAAVADLNRLRAPVGPKAGGKVTAQTIFRGETPGDLVGPYLSQLLLKPIPWGPSIIDQRYQAPVAGENFGTTEGEWLAIQEGRVPGRLSRVSNATYLYDARCLGEYVHADFSFQAYLNAALILLGEGALDTGGVYMTGSTQGGFVSLGAPDVLDLVSKAGNLALTGAWYQKWLVHRRARPEVYAGRLHFQKLGQRQYDLPADIANSEAVDRVFSQYGTYLLPLAFAEGSPTHPSYPAGHATIAGACVTVLKAFFQGDKELSNPVTTNSVGDLVSYAGTLTVEGELNKLANNVALGRDWAGVHYRSDGVDGLQVGEQQAETLLRDYSLTYNESFDGFVFRRFNGQQVRIVNGELTLI